MLRNKHLLFSTRRAVSVQFESFSSVVELDLGSVVTVVVFSAQEITSS